MASQEPIPSTPDIPQKTCTKCGERKPETAFRLAKSRGKFHRRGECKTCASAMAMEWTSQHYEIHKKRTSQYQKTHVEKVRTYHRRYRAKNRSTVRRQAREWYQDNQEKESKKRRNHYANNPDKIRGYFLRRRAIKKGLPATFSLKEQRFARHYFLYACAICGREEGFEWTIAFDHWIPLIDPNCPGTIAANMVPLCHGKRGCNNSKQKRKAEIWLKEQYGTRKAKQFMQKIEDYFEIIRQNHNP